MPLGHLGINVPDLAAAKAYYDGLMPLLDFEPSIVGDEEFSYRPAGGKIGTWIFFYGGDDTLYHRRLPGLQHLAFMVKTRAGVHAAHAWAQAREAQVLHPPQEFPQYHAGYFATFWLDPHGFMLEVVCHTTA